MSDKKKLTKEEIKKLRKVNKSKQGNSKDILK